MVFDFRRGSVSESEPGREPVMRGGVSQVGPEWLADQLKTGPDALRIIDVREVHEFDGPQGHIEGAELVPLGSLTAKVAGWDRKETLVMVCRSGTHSNQTAMVLRHMGFETVHNLQGGMIGWSRRRR